jgi:hypothetical protein
VRQARYLVLLLGSLVVSDGLISNFIVQSGAGMESNPLTQGIVGQTSFVFVKLSAAIIGSLLLWKLFRQHPRLGRAGIIVFATLYTAIVWWNLTTWFVGSHGAGF